MKALLVGEYRDGKLPPSNQELVAFAHKVGASAAMVLVGAEGTLPNFSGTLYLAEAAKHGEYNPEATSN